MTSNLPFLALLFCKNRRGIICSASSVSVPSSVLGKISKAKDHVQFYIKFNSESFLICFTDSLGCPY